MHFITITRQRVITISSNGTELLVSEVEASGPGLRDKSQELCKDRNGTRKDWEEVFVGPETDSVVYKMYVVIP